jgi:hypothetical protein
MGKKSGSGMNNLNHISENLEIIFGVKILQFFDADPGWKNLDPGWKKWKNIKKPYSTSRIRIRMDRYQCDPGSGSAFCEICGFAYRLPDVDVLSTNYRTKSDKFLKLV